MNLLTYSVKFVQPSIEFVSNNQGYKQKKKSTNSHQNKRKEGNICTVGCELFYWLWPQEEDELLSSYSFAWLLTGDFRLAKGDVKRISFFYVNGRFVRYLNPFFCHWGHPLFFLRLPSNAFPDIGSVGRIEKKNHKKSRNSRPWYPKTTLKVNIHIFGSTKCTIYCEKCSCFCSCFSLCCYYAHFSD